MADRKLVRSEDVLGQKWDRCIVDFMVKIPVGLSVGFLCSVVFFKTRQWPIAFGGGVGLGMAFANCQHEFRDPYNLRATIQPKAASITSDSSECSS